MIILSIVLSLLSQPSEKQILRDHLNKADAVVIGRIDEVYRAPEINLLPLTFNNDFNTKWYWAEIEIENSFLPKGIEYLRLKIIFPASNEHGWNKFPKFKVGDEGVFILNKLSFVKTNGERISAMMVTQQINFQPKERFEELQKLYINYPPR